MDRRAVKIDRLRKSVSWAIIATEASHVFCCVLPTVFSLLTLAAGLGLIAAVPAGMIAFHEAMHEWEVPLITLSGAMVLFGWAIHRAALRLDCHDGGCVHGPCAPKKRKAGGVLKIATALFLVNVTIYLMFHHGLDAVFHSDD